MGISQHTLERLREFFKDQPVLRAYVFGSFARGDADEKSDIDIMVELDHSTPVGMQFFRMHNELEDLLESRIDLVSTDGISKHIRPFVEADKRLVYERSD